MGNFACTQTRVRAGGNPTVALEKACERGRRSDRGIFSRRRRFQRAKNRRTVFHVSRARQALASWRARDAFQRALSLGCAGWMRGGSRWRSWAASHSHALLLARSRSGIQKREYHGGGRSEE